mmetsp:Transcript_10965/g.24949  ORF Transcript_10965/g.24949 Transcript_10965/m.24949 type:complete len:204 (-) Transcript_10965:9502-10113(-)
MCAQFSAGLPKEPTRACCDRPVMLNKRRRRRPAEESVPDVEPLAEVFSAQVRSDPTVLLSGLKPLHICAILIFDCASWTDPVRDPRRPPAAVVVCCWLGEAELSTSRAADTRAMASSLESPLLAEGANLAYTRNDDAPHLSSAVLWTLKPATQAPAAFRTTQASAPRSQMDPNEEDMHCDAVVSEDSSVGSTVEAAPIRRARV